MSVTIQTIKEKEAKLEALQKEIDADKASIKSAVIEEIKIKINGFGITAKDLGFKGDGIVKNLAAEKTVKYKKGDNTWGGKGPKPEWYKTLETAGEDMNKYKV